MAYDDGFAGGYGPGGGGAALEDYHYISVPWGTNILEIQELTPGKTYGISIAAYDFADRSDGFLDDTNVTTSQDTVPPSRPAAPVVAGNPINIQVSHTLGKNSGGTFNLEPDLDHLDVFAGTTAGFTANDASKLGSIQATAGHLLLGITAIGSFPVSDDTPRFIKVAAVDLAGNVSPVSPEATVTADLIDTAQITNLAVTNAKINDVSAGKITAGTVTGHEIIIAGGSSGILRSDNFVAGSGGAGWQMTGAGVLEANQIIARGTIEATAGDLGTLDISGTLTMTGTGGIRTALSPLNRVEIGASDPDRIDFYSGSGSESSNAVINVQAVTSADLRLFIAGPIDTTETLAINQIEFASGGAGLNKYGVAIRSIKQAVQLEGRVGGVELWGALSGASKLLASFDDTKIFFDEPVGIEDSTPDAMIDIGGTSNGPVGDIVMQARSNTTLPTVPIFNVRSDVGLPNNTKLNILGDGDVQNATGVYATLSDVRLKDPDSIHSARSYLNELLHPEMRPHKFQLTSLPGRDMLGYLAQGVETVKPGLVKNVESRSGTTREGAPFTDPAYKIVKQSLFIPMIHTAVIEIAERLEKLELESIERRLEEMP